MFFNKFQLYYDRFIHKNADLVKSTFCFYIVPSSLFIYKWVDVDGRIILNQKPSPFMPVFTCKRPQRLKEACLS